MRNKKILITGFSGFVARHFVDYLFDLKIDVEICGIDIKNPSYDIEQYLPELKIRFKTLDMTDVEQIAELFQEFIPDYILHLAAYSSVAYSWENPAESFMNNSNIFLNLIKAVQEYDPECRVLSVGSSEEYGNVDKNDLPIKENHLLQPTSPYAVARVSQEMLSKIFSETFHLNIVLTRSFNHIGPRQDDRFAVPGFINRIVNIKRRGLKRGEIETGDITVVRDFIDVRDVVRAYYLLLLKGKSGEIYNICSGRGVSLKELIQLIAKQAGVEVTTKISPKFIRPRDNEIIIGSPAKIQAELNWYPEISLDKTIHDMIEYMEQIYHSDISDIAF